MIATYIEKAWRLGVADLSDIIGASDARNRWSEWSEQNKGEAKYKEPLGKGQLAFESIAATVLNHFLLDLWANQSAYAKFLKVKNNTADLHPLCLFPQM